MKKIIIIIISFNAFLLNNPLLNNTMPLNKKNNYSIMIDPAGHKKYTGRALHTSYERSETFNFAMALKSTLGKTSHALSVIITRTPGDEIQLYQNASHTNTIEIDFFIRLHFYKELEASKPQIHIYHLVFDPINDFITHTKNHLSFTSVYQAHYTHSNTSQLYAKHITSFLQNDHYNVLFNIHNALGIPVKPLVGIIAPACIIEIGLCNDSDWEICTKPLADAIATLPHEHS